MSPCRSISQAIENASAGDIVSVGAGTYGNISGDGSYTHPGDEHPQLVFRFGGSTSAEGCIICIKKPIKVLSLHGAAATIIVAANSSAYPATVQIASDGVTFGNVGQGFTITGGNAIGVYFDQDVVTAPKKNISIGGNVDIGDGTGLHSTAWSFPTGPVRIRPAWQRRPFSSPTTRQPTTAPASQWWTMSSAVGVNSDPGDQIQVFDHNNFYGNDRNRPAGLSIEAPMAGNPPVVVGPSAHCGILNVGKAAASPGSNNGEPASPTVVQTATNNFWGSAKGPSATGPGDAAGGVCDQNGGVTVSKPFAAVDFAITTSP